MNILVSACLLGENCKYNGGNNYNQKVVDYIRGHHVIPVCPEVMGHLPTPRIPSEICQGRVINKEGTDVTANFESGAQEALACANREKIDLAIVQPRSPSCGAKEIYDGTFSGRKIAGAGIFTGQLLAMGIKVLEPEDL